MDQNERISAEPETSDPTLPEATWRWLGTVGLRSYFVGPRDAEASRLAIPGYGPCGLLGKGEALPIGINMIRDPEFADRKIRWAADISGEGMIGLARSELSATERQSPSGGCLVVTVPAEARSKRATLTLAYPGDETAARLAAEPHIHYCFAFRLTSGPGNPQAVIEFLDEDGIPISATTSEPGMPLPADAGLKRVCARAPEGTRAVRCRVEIALPKDKKDGELVFADPYLSAEETDDPPLRIAGTIGLSAFRKALADVESRIFFADRDIHQPLGADGAAEVHRDRTGRPVLSGPAAPAPETVRAEFRALRADLVEARVSGFSGPLLLIVDGAVCAAKWVGNSAKPLPYHFRVPHRLLDGDHHVLRLVDGQSLAVLGSDSVHLADQTVDWTALRDGAMPPYPAHLSPKASRRMDAMRRQLAWFGERDKFSDQDRWLLANLHRIEEALTAGLAYNRDFFALRFPQTSQPTVSIVIPVHGQYAATFHCLCSLLFARCDTAFEVIVVDDGSPDETADELKRHDGIRIVSRPTSGGFIAACNDGAAEATGEYVLFLNNDCEVTAGWLDELVASFDIFPGTGAACPKLLHADGRLQSAGTIVWKNGKPQNIGWNGNPRDPRYGYSHDTDYLAGAALITLKSLWDEIGGFEEDLAPAYFEDTWYSFAVRDKGYRTIYCAPSVVYHTRGVSNGTERDAEDSIKRFEAINHPKFKRRWHKAYQKHGAYGGDAMLEKDRGVKKRVLMIGWRVPRPDQDAGSYSTVNEMKMLRDLGCKVTFLPSNLRYGGRYTEALERIGVECVHAPFSNSIEGFLAARGAEFDVVLVSRYTILKPHIRTIRAHAPKAKLILNVEDLNFVREMRRVIALGDGKAEKDVHILRKAEMDVARQSDLVLSYSEPEVKLLEGLMGSRPPVAKLPWVEETRPGGAGFNARDGLCFLGSHQHPPNAEAVDYFAREIAPALSGKGAPLHVYGSNWPADLDDESIVIEGYAPDIAETFDRHRIFLAPLTSGAGVKGKVLLAMAHGLPTILSPVAAEGIDCAPGASCLIAETPAEWTDAIAKLSTDAKLWSTIREGGLELIERRYGRDKGIEKLRKLLEKADIFV